MVAVRVTTPSKSNSSALKLESSGVCMLNRPLRVPPEHLYPTDEWRLIETRYSDRYYARAETALALSNGYIGIRGTYDEGRPSLRPGTFVNGFHETWPIVHAEQAYGLARTGQTIINAPDATVIRLYVDDEPLFLPTARLRRYSRVLDMREGTLTRELSWSTPAGKQVTLSSCRLVSLEHRHLAAIAFEVINRQDARHHDARLRPEGLDPRRATALAHRVLDPQIVCAEAERLLLGYRAANSGMTLGVAVEHVIESAAPHQASVSADGDRSSVVLTVEAQPEVPIRVVKYIAYQSSRSEPPAELVERCTRTLNRAIGDGFGALRRAQRANLD